jgi:hypothetical protein
MVEQSMSTVQDRIAKIEDILVSLVEGNRMMLSWETKNSELNNIKLECLKKDIEVLKQQISLKSD